MPAMYHCECADGRTITGSPKWELTALRQMPPLQLAQVLSELSEFARYYESNFFYPYQKLQAESKRLENNYEKSRLLALCCGGAAGLCTFFWIILAVLPFMRFSGLTLTMAILTFLSIIAFIPVVFRFVSTQEDYKKRLPRINAKIEKLIQKQEKDIYGTYQEYLIGGYIVSPEYSLSADALNLMAAALNSNRASNMSEASLLCKRKFPRSPVPRIITSLRSVSDNAEPVKIVQPKAPIQKKSPITNMESQAADLNAVIQLSDYLNEALKSIASSKIATSGTDSMSVEEENLLHEFRTLTPDEKKRIRRIVHSFYTKQY